MIRLLVLCEYFPPENKIGAVRPSRIVKYLGMKEDITATVVCAKPNAVPCSEKELLYDGVEVLRINRSRLAGLMRRKHPVSQAPKGSAQKLTLRQRVKRLLVIAVSRFRDALDRELLYHRAKKTLRNKRFDVMISTFNTELGHRTALWYKKRNPQIRWIADFRDPTWADGMPEKQKEKMITLARETACSCDAITAVSQGIIEVHETDFGDTPCYVIPNGYDPEDRERAPLSQDGIFRLAYTGELYDGKRDLSPVLHALTHLAESGTIDLARVEVVYAGQSGAVFEGQAARYPEVPIRNEGFVSREAALNMQDRAQLLLLSSWCSQKDKHTLTGKFFEYLSADKPIVCTISGEAGESALSQAIREHGLGVCFEQANESIDFPALCAYLEHQYTCFVSKSEVDFQPDQKYIQQFSYEKIAEQFYRLIKP